MVFIFFALITDPEVAGMMVLVKVVAGMVAVAEVVTGMVVVGKGVAGIVVVAGMVVVAEVYIVTAFDVVARVLLAGVVLAEVEDTLSFAISPLNNIRSVCPLKMLLLLALPIFLLQ